MYDSSQNTFGICKAIADVGAKLAGIINPNAGEDSSEGVFRDFLTGKYKLSYFCAPTGLCFVLLSSKDDKRYSDILTEVYAKLYVEFVSKNPMIDDREGSIKCPNFAQKLKSYFKNKQP